MREVIRRRDHGICAICGADTLLQHRVVLRVRQLFDPGVAGAVARLWGVRGEWVFEGDYWQADHIVPVAEGGGACGPENIRTLCTACHKAETAALARRLALRREETINTQ